MTDEELSISDATLIARLRAVVPTVYDAHDAADRIEQLVATNEALVKERDAEHSKRNLAEGLAGLAYADIDGHSAMIDVARNAVAKRIEAEARAEQLAATNERLEAALHNCVGMLDQLVAESGRDIEWGAEDPFRMGEWFEPDDLKQLEQARAALKGD